LTSRTEMSDAELRLAHAQLVGWLQGLLHTVQTAQTALPDPHTVAANDSTTVPTAHNHHDRPHDEPCSPTKPLPEDRAPTEEDLGIRSARQTLITHHQTHHTTTPHRSSSGRRTPSHRSEGDPTP